MAPCCWSPKFAAVVVRLDRSRALALVIAEQRVSDDSWPPEVTDALGSLYARCAGRLAREIEAGVRNSSRSPTALPIDT